MALKIHYALIFLLTAVLLSGCGLFENDQQTIIYCKENTLTNSVLHVAVSKGANSYISSFDINNLEEQYRIERLREAPFYINYENNSFYYTYSASTYSESFVKRNLMNGTLLDSLPLPKGSKVLKVNDSYLIYGNNSSSYILHDGELLPKDFEYYIQPVQTIENKYYALYGDPGNLLLFGTIDTSGLSTMYELTDIIYEVTPNFSYAYDMFYIEQENRLLFTVEDYSNPPATMLFDVNLSNNNYKAYKVGDHSNIYHSMDDRYFFLSHQLTLRLTSQPTQYLTMYDNKSQQLVNIIDFKKELGAEVYIQDVAVFGCSLYIAIQLRESINYSLIPMLLKYNLQSKKIEDLLEIESFQNSQSLIYSMTLSSNPKSNRGLK